MKKITQIKEEYDSTVNQLLREYSFRGQFKGDESLDMISELLGMPLDLIVDAVW